MPGDMPSDAKLRYVGHVGSGFTSQNYGNEPPLATDQILE